MKSEKWVDLLLPVCRDQMARTEPVANVPVTAMTGTMTCDAVMQPPTCKEPRSRSSGGAGSAPATMANNGGAATVMSHSTTPSPEGASSGVSRGVQTGAKGESPIVAAARACSPSFLPMHR